VRVRGSNSVCLSLHWHTCTNTAINPANHDTNVCTTAPLHHITAAHGPEHSMHVPACTSRHLLPAPVACHTVCMLDADDKQCPSTTSTPKAPLPHTQHPPGPSWLRPCRPTCTAPAQTHTARAAAAVPGPLARPRQLPAAPQRPGPPCGAPPGRTCTGCGPLHHWKQSPPR
jgi:hypothetical protein